MNNLWKCLAALCFMKSSSVMGVQFQNNSFIVRNMCRKPIWVMSRDIGVSKQDVPLGPFFKYVDHILSIIDHLHGWHSWKNFRRKKCIPLTFPVNDSFIVRNMYIKPIWSISWKNAVSKQDVPWGPFFNYVDQILSIIDHLPVEKKQQIKNQQFSDEHLTW